MREEEQRRDNVYNSGDCSSSRRTGGQGKQARSAHDGWIAAVGAWGMGGDAKTKHRTVLIWPANNITHRSRAGFTSHVKQDQSDRQAVILLRQE